MEGFNLLIQSYDRGIQSRSISEQLATVVNTVSLVKKNPFPQFVNSIVVRLCESFVNGSNCLRASIARALGQMESELLLVFSHNEVCRRLLVVSHSNDPIARSHTLTSLGSIAPLAKDNKEVHNVVIESLSSSHKDEFSSACSAVAAYCRLSTEFTRTILAQISDYLLSTTSPIDRKIQLVLIFSDIRSDQESTQAIFALGAKLFELNTDYSFHSTLLSSLTSLAIRTRFSIVDQLSLLVKVVSSTVDTSPSLTYITLINVSRLAKHSHMWTREHIMKLCEHRSRMMIDNDVCCALIDSLVVLAKRRLPSHLSTLQELLSEMSPLYGHESPRVRASYLAFSVHVFVSSPTDIHRHNILNAITSSLSSPLPKDASVKVARVAGVFLICDSVPDDEAVNLVLSLCDLGLNHSNTSLFIHLFSLLSQKRKCLITPIAQWANNALKSECNLSRSQLSFMAYPPYGQSNLFDITPIISLPYTLQYEVARTGFRNGHWYDVSRPLLEKMKGLSLSDHMHGWITSLYHLSSSQPRSFCVSDMKSSVEHLTRARYGLNNMSRSSSIIRPHSFCYRYVEALEKTRLAQLHLLSSIFLFVSSTEDDPLRHCSYRLNGVLESVVPKLRTSMEEWHLLIRRAVDGDDATIDYLLLEYSCASILLNGVKSMIERKPRLMTGPPSISCQCVSLVNTRSLLLWATSSIQQLGGRNAVITREILEHFIVVLKELYTRPIFVPRFFFQSTRKTDIKLSVSPGSQGELSVSPKIPVPIRIDGVITSTVKTTIESITVSANIHYYNASGRDTIERRVVDTHDGIFFTAQFLMHFTEAAQLDFSVEFVDEERRKTWLSDATATLRVDVSTR